MSAPRKATRGAKALAKLVAREKLSETAVGAGVAAMIAMVGGRIYNAETGFLGHYEDDPNGGKAIRRARRGGTRSTPGTPDMPVVLMSQPWRYTLTVELKGSSTEIKPKDWVYALDAASYGQPHLIVRSTEELLTGLRYLGLLPDVLHQVRPQDWTAWPQNLNFLDLTLANADLWRERADIRRAQDGLPPGRFRTGWWDEDRMKALMAKRPNPMDATMMRR